MLTLLLAALISVGPPKADPGFVLVKPTKLTLSWSPTKPGERLIINIHAEGVVPKSGYLAPMLMPNHPGLTVDGFDEYNFQAIRNVEDGVEGETVIVADGQFRFDPAKTKLKGIRVFGPAGTKVEKTLPPFLYSAPR
jgi:hypothetical protein